MKTYPQPKHEERAYTYLAEAIYVDRPLKPGQLAAAAEILRHAIKVGSVTQERKPTLYAKYCGLRRTRDDSPVEGFYFVLREHDPHAQSALEAYAASCEDEMPELAADLRRVVKDAQTLHGLYDAGWER